MNKSIRIVILLTIYFSLATTLNAQLNYGTFSSPSLTTPLRVGLNTPTSVPDAQLHLYSEYRVACEGCVGPYDVPNFLITREYNTLIPPPSSPSALKPFMEVRYTDNTWSPSIVKTHFLLNGLGNLGLGTGTPIARLHVEGTSYLNGNVGIGTFNNGVASVEIDRSSNTLWGAFILNHAGNGRVLRLKGGFANGTQPIFQVEANTWGTNDLVEDNIRFRVLGNGDVQVNNLAGTGTRMVVADASGYLSTLPTPGNQQLFVNGNTLGITNGNTVIIPGDNLGNHTASTDLNMSSYSLYGIKGLSFANGGAELTMFNNTLEIRYNDVQIMNNLAIGGVPSSTYALMVYGDAWATGSWLSSDSRFKQNVTNVHGALSSVQKLQGVTYTFKQSEFSKYNFTDRRQIGFLAQDLQKVFPELVSEGEDGYLAVNYVGLIPVLTEAIKEQQVQIAEKDAQLAAMETKFNSLQNRLDAIEQSMQSCCFGAQPGTNTGSTDKPVLEQNTPNPFSQSTVIRYYLPSNAGTAVINVHSTDGKLVGNYSIAQKGYGNITINANTLSSGTYMYELIVDGKTIDTKKMVITQQ